MSIYVPAEAMDADTDCDSHLDDTHSLTSPVTNYPIEHGRRYHRYHEGAYVYPNDEPELDRLDLQHHLYTMVLEGRLLIAPLQDPERLLDIGTGSGIWPIEAASVFPNARIIGTDLSPVQPTAVPPNVDFLIDDAREEDWLWNDNHFDFIRAAHLTGSLPSFEDLARKAFRYTKPGGYLECHEVDPRLGCDDGSLPMGKRDGFSEYALHDWLNLSIHSGLASDPPRQFRIAHQLAQCMRAVGFVDIKEHIFKVPMNTWPRDERMKVIGAWNERNWLDALSGWSYKPFFGMGWSTEEIEVFLVNVRKSIQDRSVHAYIRFYVVTGRKPLAEEQES
ncbi:uncharacterized protein GIQ15_06341 [Arthroderma uncinatum]|uniref:uncharacterized protein n=1 Tax=Arthroderma uncinatum TaxID=74035 RepID=UPI00144ADCB2|nr:uncharacterized protein GIQ15_06341 [Arthroderma uncinatum]KAF3480994.1 hypothetical protein GIQ15_06341 [Arthroderma uncinatum]